VDTKRKSLVGQVTATEMARSYVTAVRREGDNDEEFMRTKVFGYLIANLIDFYDWDPAMTRATLRKQLNLKDLISAPPLMPALPMPIPQAKQKGNPSLPPSLFLVQVLTLFWLGKKKDFEQLLLAILGGEIDKVKARVGDATFNINWRNENGFTPLHAACEAAQLAVILILLRVPKIDVNLPAKTGATPFFMASLKGHRDVVALMMSFPRVDINKPQTEGATPLFVACQKGLKEVVYLFLGDPRTQPNLAMMDGGTPFLMACQKGHKEVVALMMTDQRVDLNLATKRGHSPFFAACQSGHKEVVSLLLANPKVDVNQTNKDNTSPLWIATQEGHLPVVQLVLLSGRDIDITKKSTFTNTTAAEHGRNLASKPKVDGEGEADFLRKRKFGPVIADLIEAFAKDPRAVREQLKKELGQTTQTK